MIQIYWKGDPGVENFVVKFPSPDSMHRWRDAVQGQKDKLGDSSRVSGTTGTSDTELVSLNSQKLPQNPYLQEDDNDDDNSAAATLIGPDTSSFNISRNTSNTSLRSGSTSSRVPPPRFPIPEPGYATGLNVRTNVAPQAESPGEFGGNSYFSPGGDSPQSSRSSQQVFGFNHGIGHGNQRISHSNDKRRTEPPMPRAPSRDGMTSNTYNMNGRTVQRPSLPAMTASQAAQQHMAINSSRLRSASTPDIHNEPRRYANGALQGTTDSVPVPPLPPNIAQHRAQPGLNRSQTSSPISNQLPYRTVTQSPQPHPNNFMPHHLPTSPRDHNLYTSNHQRPKLQETDTQKYAPQYFPQTSNNNPDPQLQILKTPPLPSNSNSSATSGPFVPGTTTPYPSQLKVKVWFDPPPSHVTIVVPIIIKHQSLIDRIDSKMVKISQASIGRGTARLKYKDEEEDLVTISNDEGVQMAIEDWGTQHLEDLERGLAPDFELYWSAVK